MFHFFLDFVTKTVSVLGSGVRLLLKTNTTNKTNIMKLKSLKVLGLLAACALAAGSVQAQDKALLNTLVQKGYLTQAESDQIAANSVAIKPGSSATKSLTFSGLIHTQFNWVSNNDKTANSTDPAATTSFQMRRVYLGAAADLGNGWGASIVANFGEVAPGVAATRNYLDEAVITKKVDWDLLQGTLTAGYRKVNFGYEETTSAANIAAVERSIASFYWNSDAGGTVGFGGRHVGVYWDGRVNELEGLYYGVALTNQLQNNLGGQPAASDNDISIWANVGMEGELAGVNVDGGVNFGYKPGGNPAGAVAGTQSEIVAFNPYLNLNWQGLNLLGEAFFTDARHARADATRATPFGLSVIPSYRINEEFEVVARWSHLQTNGAGVNPSTVVPGAANPTNGRGFNRADSFYFGGNWYIMGNDVKLSAGYEWTQFSGAVNAGPDDRYNVNAVRTRLQILF